MSACYAAGDFNFVGLQTLQKKCIYVFVAATVTATIATAAAAIATASKQQHLLSTAPPKPAMDGTPQGGSEGSGVCVCVAGGSLYLTLCDSTGGDGGVGGGF